MNCLRHDASRTVLTERPRLFLLIGAILICGCFFSGVNVAYRGVHLLFVLPAMLILAREAPLPGARRLFGRATWAILLVLWDMPVRRIVAAVFGGQAYPIQGSLALYSVWLARELAWWFLAAVLLSLLFGFFRDSLAAWRPGHSRSSPKI